MTNEPNKIKIPRYLICPDCSKKALLTTGYCKKHSHNSPYYKKLHKKCMTNKIIGKIEIILERNPCNSKVLVDGKILPVRGIEITQSMNNLLEATLYIFPDKVTILRDKMAKNNYENKKI